MAQFSCAIGVSLLLAAGCAPRVVEVHCPEAPPIQITAPAAETAPEPRPAPCHCREPFSKWDQRGVVDPWQPKPTPHPDHGF